MSTIDKYTREFSVIVIILTFIICFMLYYQCKPNVYEVKLGDEHIAYVKDKSDFENILTKIKKDMNQKFESFKLKDDFSLKKIKVKKEILENENEDEIKKAICQNSSIKVEAVMIKSDGKELGIVANKDEGIQTLTVIRNYYANKNNLNNIIDSKVKNSIDFIKVNSYISRVKTPDEIGEYIITNNIFKDKKPLVSFEIKGYKKEEVKIIPTTIIKWSKDLSDGSVKVLSDGKEGVKVVDEEITLENDIIVSKKPISEKVLETSIQRVVLKGNKIGVNKSKNSKSVSTYSLALLRPCRGSISSPFGRRWGRIHKGIDIAANKGTPIKAAYDGTISYAGWIEGYGKVVKINHGNGLETLYAHCSAIKVKKGQNVKKGELIGNVGSTGHSTGPHVHFEVRINGIAQNPVSYIKNSA
ncbi:peptidoglycan DD-metalloendopeptidase family protein [Clostridium aestuarii]|uniref:Peptidoglycan DD-metalloendopeptidase family protein n=1 Tax=Clostridium aestuarii TaxID=338193 RepID=A0ABT4D3R5_9CLOT|nr:M23 family metallopeptidase [Clostridium aestuarii]MCY6485287.1 peptidoglycan DD-metalloendopeptidase family protein [Clostridium aestuarii]